MSSFVFVLLATRSNDLGVSMSISSQEDMPSSADALDLVDCAILASASTAEIVPPLSDRLLVYLG